MSILSRLRRTATETSPAMRRVIDVLEEEGAEYTLTDGQVDVEDVGGSIFELDGEVYFTHANTQPHVPADSPDLERIVRDYLAGSDEFAETARELMKF